MSASLPFRRSRENSDRLWTPSAPIFTSARLLRRPRPHPLQNWRAILWRRHWPFLGPGTEKKWVGTDTDKPDGSWDRVAEEIMLNFSDSDHPIFRASIAFERGELRSKGGGRSLFTSTVVMKTSNELPKDLSAPGKLVAPDHLETMEIPTRPSAEETQTNAQQRETKCKTTSGNSSNCQKTRHYPNYVLMRV